MKLCEMTCTVDRHGGLKIPARALRKMGLGPSDHVRIAYMTRDGDENLFREFYLSADGVEDGSEAETLSLAVPCELLRQAGLSDTEDVQLICLKECLLLCRDPGLTVEELAGVLEALQVTEGLMDLPADKLERALNGLADAFQKEEP